MTSATAPNTSSALKRAACVVLQPCSTTLPDSARQWLATQGWECLVANEPLLALAALCLIERGQAQRAAWGLQRTEHIALLVIDDGGWPDFDLLMDAIERHLPAIDAWTVRQGEVVRLREDEPAHEAAAGKLPLVTASPRHSAVPSASTVPTARSVAAAADSDSVSTADDHRRITREEIAMLLDERFEDAAP